MRARRSGLNASPTSPTGRRFPRIRARKGAASSTSTRTAATNAAPAAGAYVNNPLPPGSNPCPKTTYFTDARNGSRVNRRAVGSRDLRRVNALGWAGRARPLPRASRRSPGVQRGRAAPFPPRPAISSGTIQRGRAPWPAKPGPCEPVESLRGDIARRARSPGVFPLQLPDPARVARGSGARSCRRSSRTCPRGQPVRASGVTSLDRGKSRLGRFSRGRVGNVRSRKTSDADVNSCPSQSSASLFAA